jgi:phage terminase small subunit
MIVSELKLSVKQKRFCDEYLVDLNATQAAIRAGYSEKTAYSQGQRLLKHVEAKEYIDQRMAEKQAELIADQDEVLKYLTSVMRREYCENVVVTVSEKKSFYEPDLNGTMRKVTEEKEEAQIVEIPARLTDANKAAELLGRRYGLFKDSVDLNGAIPVVISGADELED